MKRYAIGGRPTENDLTLELYRHAHEHVLVTDTTSHTPGLAAR
jgi:hypothetical protein